MAEKRILIIDDDPLFHVVASQLFHEAGTVDIVNALNGIEGMSMIRTRPETFDLVVCDLNMPELDGIGVIRELGAMDFPGSVAIVSSETRDVVATVRNVAELVGVRIVGGLTKPLRAPVVRTLLEATPPARRADRADVMSKQRLKAALASGNLVPVYQPLLDLRHMQVTSCEALLRLRNAEGALGSAQDHLLAAEEHGLMTALTLNVVDQVLSDLIAYRQRGLSLSVAVNLSPTTLKDRELPGALISRVRAASLSTEELTLEITENRIIDFEADTLEVLSRLRIAGFRISIDDFGTGATSIEQLRKFPFTEMKVDRAFIHGAASDAFARETVRASVRLARLLKLKTVAEGIETATDLKFAAMVGFDKAQGYLIARPMPRDRLLAWMGARPARKAAQARVA